MCREPPIPSSGTAALATPPFAIGHDLFQSLPFQVQVSASGPGPLSSYPPNKTTSPRFPSNAMPGVGPVLDRTEGECFGCRCVQRVPSHVHVSL